MINLVAHGVGFAVVPTYVLYGEEQLSRQLVFLDDSKLNFPDSHLTLVYKDYSLEYEPIKYLANLLLDFSRHEINN